VKTSNLASLRKLQAAEMNLQIMARVVTGKILLQDCSWVFTITVEVITLISFI
jgi:hypothetical protein